MTGKSVNRYVILLLAAALVAVLVAPVLADASTAQGNTDPAGTAALAVPQENIQAFDQDSQAAIPAPYALTEVTGLTIDPALVNATPYWVYLAAGKKEQQGLVNYIRNSSVSQKKKMEWIQFLQAEWKKYPMKFIRRGSSATITLARPAKEYSLTKKEVATFAEIDDQITVDMKQTASQGIHPMFAGDQHIDFMTAAMRTENYIPDNLKLIANQSAPIPDTWYSNDEAGKLEHSLNHGYFVLTSTTGLGLAPLNTGTYALTAKAEFLTHDYTDAFTNLGYSSHFMGDLGQPFHTPNPLLLASTDWLFYDIGPFSGDLSTKIQHYEIFHNGYESSVAAYWDTPLPNYKKSLSYYANADTAATVIVDPATSATLHADASSAEIVPIYYLCEWHYFFNKDFDYMSDPVIATLTIDRVKASVENIRGLVRYVTGGQAPTLTITTSADEHGSISPAGSVAVIYGNSQSFTITPDSGYALGQILVDNSSVTQQNPYPFNDVTTDHTISVTFRKANEWNWATDGWGDWQHTTSWSGTQTGTNAEYGPVIVNDSIEGVHGEHGTITNLNAGSTQSSVWKTFTDPSGTGWNTITFKGLLQATDTLGGRWMTININGNQVFGATALQSPPGNGVPFEITRSFNQSPVVTVKISNGQNPAWRPQFTMHFYSVTLSKGETSTMNSMNAPTSLAKTIFTIPDGSEWAGNNTTVSPTETAMSVNSSA